MNQENTDKLFSEFPEFFKHKDDMRASLMGFGFACGDGWYDIIYKLMQDIKAIYDAEKESFYVTQVKEKFAGLRFYVSATSKEVFALIHEAESKSYVTCENCGKPGTVHRRGRWYQTLCTECAGDEWVKADWSYPLKATS